MDSGGDDGAPVTGLSHIQLVVSDVAASAAWYTEVLGLEPYAADPDHGYAALRHRRGRFVIVLSAPAPDAPVRGPGRLDHLAFAVDDEPTLAAWAARLTERGFDHVGVVAELGNRSVHLRDPDGLAVEIVAPGPSGD